MGAERNENYEFKIFPEEAVATKINTVTPSDRELEWDKSKVLNCKTDSKGTILYANEAFIDVCGYDDYELMNKSISLIRHPDMPKIIFKLLWQNLNNGVNSNMIMKNMSKTGRFFWVLNNIECAKDSNDNYTYTGRQKSISHEVILKIEPLYKKLLQIEAANGIQSSENYLTGFLEEKNKSLLEFMNCSIDNNLEIENSKPENTTKKKGGFFSNFFAE